VADTITTEPWETLPDFLLERICIRSTTDCWTWVGASDNKLGYGRVSVDGANRPAHRVVHEALRGPVNAETLDHLCRNPPCVNPSHLQPVSIRENTLRGDTIPAKNLRKTHCPRGHLLVMGNLLPSRGIRRVCWTCDANRTARRRTAQHDFRSSPSGRVCCAHCGLARRNPIHGGPE
jgi:hypothetical protein